MQAPCQPARAPARASLARHAPYARDARDARRARACAGTHARIARMTRDAHATRARTGRTFAFATKAKQPLSPRFRLARVLTRPSRRSSFLRDSGAFGGHLTRRSNRLARHARHARATHARDPFAVCVGIRCTACNFFQTLSAQSFAPRFSPFCSLFGVGIRYRRADREGRVFRPVSASFRFCFRLARGSQGPRCRSNPAQAYRLPCRADTRDT